MSLVNVAIEKLGAKIKTSSSFIDDLHHPANILKPNDNSLWTTNQGLPQFVIVSLSDLNVNFKSINEVKFLLWHDYDTNPKTIELWVAESTGQEFVFWAEFRLNQKKGVQLFQIQPLPSRFIYLKISITETYGAFETYLNQVFLMAEQVTSKKKTIGKQDIVVKNKKQLNLEDLQSGLNELIEMDRRISRSKSKSSFKNKPQKIPNKNIRQSDLFSPQMMKSYKEDEESREYASNGYYSSSSNQVSQGMEMMRRGKENKRLWNYMGDKKFSLGNQSQNYLKQHRNLPSTHYDERVRTLNENEQEEEKVEEQQSNPKEDEMVEIQQSEDNQKGQLKNALFTLSENVIKLEDNMEAIQRRVQVLDMKVLHSHEKIQMQLFEKLQTKVEQIVERKLKSMYNVKNFFKRIEGEQQYKQQKRTTFEKKDQKFNYKKNLTKQFFKSEYQQQENERKQKDKTKSKRRTKENVVDYTGEGVSDFNNRLKTTKSLSKIAVKAVNPIQQQQGATHRQDLETKRRLPNKQHLARLLQKLSAKLKERQTKLSKMQREKEKKGDPAKVSQTDRHTSKTNRYYNKRTLPNNLEQ